MTDGETYKCPSLNSCSSQLKPGSTLVIDKIVRDKETKNKSAIFTCACAEDWAALVKYMF